MKTKHEFITRIMTPENNVASETNHETLENAASKKLHDHQVTFDDMENNRVKYRRGYTHIMEFRDGEHYNDLYFIN